MGRVAGAREATHGHGFRRCLAVRARGFASSLLAILVLTGCPEGSGAPKGDALEQLASVAARDDVNVVFVLIDTLRADHLGSYGYSRRTSPNLDALAAQGVRFARVVSQSSWTKSSMASMWTGQYPAVTGVLRHDDALSDSAVVAAEILQGEGFRTIGIWRNGWVAPTFGFSQGFHAYQKPAHVATGNEPSRPSRSIPGTDWDTTASAIEFLRGAADERFLLYLHLMDVHQYVYDPSVADFGVAYRDLYDSAIAWVDTCVGHLLEALDALELRDRTLVVVASDHGEGFREHRHEGHGRTLYGEVTSVPWLIRLPFPLERAATIEGTVQNVDIWPTVLDLLGLPALPDADGRSQLRQIAHSLGGPEPGEETRPALSHLDRAWGRPSEESQPLVAATGSRYRLIRWPSGAIELYDLVSDPAEQRDLGDGGSGAGASLRVLVDAYLARAPREAVHEKVTVSEMELGQLRALGYLVRPADVNEDRRSRSPSP